MPTTRPRYQITDTGAVREMLDRAERAWPDASGDRKALLLRLAEQGAEALPAPAQYPELPYAVGDWVAELDGRVIAADPDVSRVIGWLKANDVRRASLSRVPSADQQEFGAHGVGGV